ncbi:MAG: hypothetical protein QM793_00905 [Muricomes sp.]
MYQVDNEIAQEMISMEQYLKIRQEKRKIEMLKEPVRRMRAAEWNAVMELTHSYV